VASPDVNVVVTKKCKVLPIEFVVRGYITGSTDTSMWYNYNKGVRSYCGHNLPEGLQKNQKLEKNIVTPTTKEIKHDRLITANQIISEGWLTKQQWDFTSQKALELFERITNQKFTADFDYSKVNNRIINNVKNYINNNLLKYG